MQKLRDAGIPPFRKYSGTGFEDGRRSGSVRVLPLPSHPVGSISISLHATPKRKKHTSFFLHSSHDPIVFV